VLRTTDAPYAKGGSWIGSGCTSCYTVHTNGLNHREKYLQGPIDCITNTTQLIGIKGRIGLDNMTNAENYNSAKKVGYALVGGWDHIGDDVIPTYSLGFGQLDQ